MSGVRGLESGVRCHVMERLWLQVKARERLWLQGKAASKTHSFKDAELQPVIQPKAKKNHEIFSNQLRPGISTSLSTIDVCLPTLHDNEVLSVTTESVSLDLEMTQNIPCYVFASVWLCGSASKWALKTGC